MQQKDKDKDIVKKTEKTATCNCTDCYLCDIYKSWYVSPYIEYMFCISMLLIQLFIWQFWYSDDSDNDYIDYQHDNSADDQYHSFVYMCNFIIFITYHMFSGIDLWIVWCYLLVWEELWMS